MTVFQRYTELTELHPEKSREEIVRILAAERGKEYAIINQQLKISMEVRKRPKIEDDSTTKIYLSKGCPKRYRPFYDKKNIIGRCMLRAETVQQSR